MPFEVAEKNTLTVFRFTGRIDWMDLSEIIKWTNQFESDSHATTDCLIDFTHVEGFDISWAEVGDFAKQFKASVLKSPIKVTFLVDGDLAFGMARMFTMHLEHPLATIRIIKDQTGAEACFVLLRDVF